jgi:WD40 repeat protein
LTRQATGLATNPEGTTVYALPCATTPAGRLVLTGGNDGQVRLYTFEGERLAVRRVLDHAANWVTTVAISPDARYVALGTNGLGRTVPGEVIVLEVDGLTGF